MPFRGRCKPGKLVLAQKMRELPTRAERLLWGELIKRPHGLKFRRQEIILGWIADFYCVKKRLIIEIDGGYHDTPQQQALDARRDGIMARHRVSTMRATNEEVLANVNAVIERILAHPDRARGYRRAA